MVGFDFEYNVKGEKLSWLKPILKEWGKVHRDYIEDEDFKDALYWYNERANVGALAAAAWRSGGFAIEEYSARKGHEKASGRIDLRFGNEEGSALAEAKKKWVHFTKTGKNEITSKINQSLESAEDAIDWTLQGSKAVCGLAISFVATYWAIGYEGSKHLADFKKEVKGADCHFYAYFSTGERDIKGEENVCNAIALIGRNVSP